MVEEKRNRGNIQCAKLHVIVVGQNIVYCWPEYCMMHLRILHIVFVGHNVTYCWSAEEGGPGEYCMENNPKTINRQRMRDVTSSCASYWVGLNFEYIFVGLVKENQQ